MSRTLFFLVFLLFCGCRPEPIPTPASPSPLLSSASAVTFTDVTQSAGIRFRHQNGATGKKLLPETMSGGGGFIDIDADGWLDIVLVNSAAGQTSLSTKGASPFLTLYHNNRKGAFREESQRIEWKGECYGMGVVVADYDNDGFDDLYVTGIPQGKLFHNLPDGKGGRKLVEVTGRSGLVDKGWSASGAWLDYDRDGKLDLFITHYVQWSPQKDQGSF